MAISLLIFLSVFAGSTVEADTLPPRCEELLISEKRKAAPISRGLRDVVYEDERYIYYSTPSRGNSGARIVYLHKQAS